MIDLLRQTLREFSADQCTQLAAALAYYTLFSLAPLMVLIMTIAAVTMKSFGMIDSEEVINQQVLSQLGDYVGEKPAAQIGALVENANEPNKSTMHMVLSIAALLFGATAIVGQLQYSLNQVWGVKPDAHQNGVMAFVRKRVLSFAMIMAIAFILLVSLILSTAVHAVNDSANAYLGERFAGWLPLLSEVVLQLLVTTLLFAAIFKFLPDTKIAWRDVVVGALVTAVLFSLGRHLIGLYLSNSQVESAFGAAGSLVALVVWIYYSSLILLVGAEFTQVWSSTKRPNYQDGT